MHPTVESFKAHAHDLQNRMITALSLLSFTDGLRVFGVLVLAVVVFTLVRVFILNLTSPLRHFPGPPSPSILFGNLWQIFHAPPGAMQMKWSEEYGDTFKYKVLLGVRPFSAFLVNHSRVDPFVLCMDCSKIGCARWTL